MRVWQCGSLFRASHGHLLSLCTQRMNGTLKQCIFNSAGNKFRLDDVLLLVYCKANAFFETRFRDKRSTTLSTSKRMNGYEDRVVRAKTIVNEALEPGSEKIKIVDKELGRAEVKGDGKSSLLKLSAHKGRAPVYKVDLSTVSCTCGDILALACKHILAVAMLLPNTANRFKIGLLSTRQADVEAPEQDFEEYLRTDLLSPAPAAPSPAVSTPPPEPEAASPQEPFLPDAEGAFLLSPLQWLSPFASHWEMIPKLLNVPPQLCSRSQCE
jgi:hypothetical protein